MCELVTNDTFFVNRVVDHSIGCVNMILLPVYIKKNKAVIGLETEFRYSKRYTDNLCLFRCLALHRGCDVRRFEPAVKTLYETYNQDAVPMEQFAGVTMKDFYRVETTFQTNVCVYSLVKPDEEDERPTAELVRRSVCKYPTTLYLNLHETHFSFIQDVRMYCHSYRCRKCNSLWTHAWKLRQHENTCTSGVRRTFPGGVYHSTPSIFERLDDENNRVDESLRYYPYRATFDFECWFDTEHLPSDSDQVHWVARHVPLRVSVASNVPGHERVKCLVTNGDTNMLVINMMTILISMSDAAYDSIKDSNENVLEQLAEAMTRWDEQEETALSAANDKKSRHAKNPYKQLMGKLYAWMRQLPVDGFNSGQYDLNVFKQFLVRYLCPLQRQRNKKRGSERKKKRTRMSGRFSSSSATTLSCVF